MNLEVKSPCAILCTIALVTVSACSDRKQALEPSTQAPSSLPRQTAGASADPLPPPPQVVEPADPTNRDQVTLGKVIYSQYCASCHGVKLEGQPNWRRRKTDGRLPAPPHDTTGHTWEHPDETLFRVTKQGVATFAGPNYQTDMVGFGNALRDEEIWAVIAYIKSTWPPELLKRRQPRTN